jgi:ketosteroid isomerase-like protein
MMDSSDSAKQLDTVQRLVDALSSGDIEAAVRVFTADGVVWHNFDALEKPASAALASVGSLLGKGLTYEVVRRYAVPDGVIQQQVLRTNGPGGPAELHSIWRVVCDANNISRIEEYFDIAQGSALAGPT